MQIIVKFQSPSNELSKYMNIKRRNVIFNLYKIGNLVCLLQKLLIRGTQLSHHGCCGDMWWQPPTRDQLILNILYGHVSVSTTVAWFLCSQN